MTRDPHCNSPSAAAGGASGQTAPASPLAGRSKQPHNPSTTNGSVVVQPVQLLAKMFEASERVPTDRARHPDGMPSLDAVKQAYVLHVVETCRGNRSVAARVLGVDRKTLYRMLAQWGWQPRRTRRSEPRHGED
jgi:DNA-binding NtrC family response regulator